MHPEPGAVFPLQAILDIELLAALEQRGICGGHARQIIGMNPLQPRLPSSGRADLLRREAIHPLDVRADEVDGAQCVGPPGHVGDVRDERAELLLAVPQRRLGLKARRDVAEAPDAANRLGFEGARCAVTFDVAAVDELESLRDFLTVPHSLDGFAETVRILDQV